MHGRSLKESAGYGDPSRDTILGRHPTDGTCSIWERTKANDKLRRLISIDRGDAKGVGLLLVAEPAEY